MKKILIAFLILIGFSANSQTYQKQYFQWEFTKGQRFDSTFRIYNLPTFTGDTVIGFNPSTKKIGLRIILDVDTSSLSNRINLKYNTSDSSKWHSQIVNLNNVKLNKADTITLSNRINLKGTVTSVAAGNGLTGGTITTTGTHYVDTTKIASLHSPNFITQINSPYYLSDWLSADGSTVFEHKAGGTTIFSMKRGSSYGANDLRLSAYGGISLAPSNGTTVYFRALNTGISAYSQLNSYSNFNAESGVNALFFSNARGEVYVGTNTQSPYYTDSHIWGTGQFHVRSSGTNKIRMTATGGNRNYLAFDACRGSFATPTALMSGDYFTSILGVGLPSGDTIMRHGPQIDFQTTENWTTTAQGNSINFLTIPNGSTTQGSNLYLSGGNVGIGTTSLLANIKAEILGTSGNSGYSGTNQTASLRIRGSSNNSMDFGAQGGSPYGTWIQSIDAGNLATSYPLLLQPRFGKVGINTLDPVSTFHIATAPSAISAYGLVSLASGNFTGSGVQPFAGAAGGTVIAINTAANTAANFADWQHKGISKFKVDSLGNTVTVGKLSSTMTSVTIAAAATTFAETSNVVTVTGDGGGNTIATITGGVSGQELTLLFVDALVTITDQSATTANTVNLSAAFTSAANTVLKLVYNGNKWFEVSRSVN